MAITRRQFLWGGLTLAVAGVTGITLASQPGAARYEYRAMSVAEMKADHALIVDVRTAPEWQASGVIEGATLATFIDPERFLARIKADLAPGQDLILVCHSGRRSSAAAEKLAGLIPNHIISVQGGMSRLIAEGYRTVAPKS